MGARTGGAAIVVAMAMVVATAVAVAAAAEGPAPAVSCGDAVGALAPCGAFLMGAGGQAAAAPGARCCRGALALRRMAATAGARRAVCRCLEQAGPSFGVLSGRARQLPARCNLRLAIPLGPDTFCDKIS